MLVPTWFERGPSATSTEGRDSSVLSRRGRGFAGGRTSQRKTMLRTVDEYDPRLNSAFSPSAPFAPAPSGLAAREPRQTLLFAPCARCVFLLRRAFADIGDARVCVHLRHTWQRGKRTSRPLPKKV